MGCRSCADQRRAVWQAARKGAVVQAGRLVVKGATTIVRQLVDKPRKTRTTKA